ETGHRRVPAPPTRRTGTMGAGAMGSIDSPKLCDAYSTSIPYGGLMIERILAVGGLTLVSRVTGFIRDIMLAAILGAGPVADAFFVALRLPNHFRAIFAEGAFNAAFVPAYARVRGQGEASARLFADRIFTLLFSA